MLVNVLLVGWLAGWLVVGWLVVKKVGFDGAAF
jgi:hypothetical protein